MGTMNLTVKEKMLIAAILKEYWEQLNTQMQKQKTTLFGNNPILINLMNNELIKVKNWINLEIASLGLNVEMLELAIFSNYAWKELDIEKKKEFVQKINIFFLSDDSIIFDKKQSIIKSTSKLTWYSILNYLNS